MIVVSDSAPLISLAKIGRFELLERFFGTVCIPEGVYAEVVLKGRGRGGQQEIIESEWVQVKHTKNSSLFQELQEAYHIGRGEAEVIVLGLELSADLLLLDERRARLVAVKYGLNKMGTLGLLELAYVRGLVSDLRQTYVELKAKSVRIDDRLLNDSLMRYGVHPLS